MDWAIATDTVDALARQSVTMVLCGESYGMINGMYRRENGHGDLREGGIGVR